MDTERCEFCQANFRAGIVKNGKCPECAKTFGDARSMKEWKEMQNKSQDQDLKDRKAFVQEIVEKMLLKHKVFKTCECGNFYFRTSPNQKRCGNCKETD